MTKKLYNNTHDLIGRGQQADLTVANNVLAHVPDINDFVKGFSLLLKEDSKYLRTRL